MAEHGARWLALVALAALGACDVVGRDGKGESGTSDAEETSSPSTESTDSEERILCEAYLDCAASVEPDQLGPLMETYGADGDCWTADASEQERCLVACEAGLLALQEDHPDVSVCYEKIPYLGECGLRGGTWLLTPLDETRTVCANGYKTQPSVGAPYEATFRCDEDGLKITTTHYFYACEADGEVIFCEQETHPGSHLEFTISPGPSGTSASAEFDYWANNSGDLGRCELETPQSYEFVRY